MPTLSVREVKIRGPVLRVGLADIWSVQVHSFCWWASVLSWMCLCVRPREMEADIRTYGHIRINSFFPLPGGELRWERKRDTWRPEAPLAKPRLQSCGMPVICIYIYVCVYMHQSCFLVAYLLDQISYPYVCIGLCLSSSYSLMYVSYVVACLWKPTDMASLQGFTGRWLCVAAGGDCLIDYANGALDACVDPYATPHEILTGRVPGPPHSLDCSRCLRC